MEERNDWNQEEAEHFGEYLHELRTEQKWNMNSLCYGVCSVGQMGKIEYGTNVSDKLVQERLLERLGVSPTDFENLYDKKDYDRWKNRRHIQRSLQEGKWEEADRRITCYQEKYGTEDPLEYQYILGVRGDLQKNTKREEGLSGLYGQAIRQTMPDFGEIASPWETLFQYPLSVYELNLVMEYISYCPMDIEKKKQILMQMILYLDNRKLDEEARAKLFPKIVYVLWMLDRNGSQTDMEAHFARCEKAISLLQKTSRLYYMWELLEMQSDILHKIDPDCRREAAWQKNREWKETLENLCNTYHVPEKMLESCYLNEVSEVYCISDVVRKRRKMLGIRSGELCEGICDIKTLQRLEQGEKKTQRAILQDLLPRLNLSVTNCRTEIQTKDHKARRLMRKIRRAINDYDVENMQALMKEISGRISEENVINHQVLERHRLNMTRFDADMTGEKYKDEILRILNITLPTAAALSDKPKYMTNEELMCVQNLIKAGYEDHQLEERCVAVLREFYREIESENLVGGYISMYEAVMRVIASYLGDGGKYEESDQICYRLIREALLCKESGIIHSSIYCVLWNRKEKSKKENILQASLQNILEDMKTCIIMAELSENEKMQIFYKERLKTWLENDYFFT